MRSPHEIDHHGWQRTFKFLGLLGFSAFALWLFASKFDQSEVKTLLTMAGPFAVKEFWPFVKGVFSPTTKLLTPGS